MHTNDLKPSAVPTTPSLLGSIDYCQCRYWKVFGRSKIQKHKKQADWQQTILKEEMKNCFQEREKLEKVIVLLTMSLETIQYKQLARMMLRK